jgi:diguanylate cyclase (GGDEF)-like protein
MAAALAAAEHRDFDTFQTTVAEIRRRRLTPRRVWPQQRSLWLYLAWGRLAACRHAEPDEPAQHRAALLAEAKRAVAAFGTAANTPALHAFHHAARAEYLRLAGDCKRALRHLARADEIGQPVDLPLLECEVATVRARALRDSGRHTEAGRQARQALQVATEHGWVHRARDLRVEFRVADTSRTAQRTGTGGTSSTGTSLAGRRLAALQQISLAAATVLEPDRLARVALDETIKIFAAERAILFLPHPDSTQPGAPHLVPHLGRGADGNDLDELTGYGATLIEQVRETGKALVVTSGEHGAALGSHSVLVHGLRSVMIAPLQLNGELLGVLYLDSRIAKGVFTEDDVDILTAITNQVAAAMLTARAAQLATTVRAAERRGELADTMRTAIAEINKTLDPATVTARLLATLVETVGADTGVVIQDDGTCLQSVAGDTIEAVVREPAGTTVTSLLAAVDSPRCQPIGPSDPLAAEFAPEARSQIALPLVSRERRVGTLLLLSTSEAYDHGQVRVAAALAEQGMVAYDNAVLFTRVQQLASTDALTDLHNRRHFFDLGETAVQVARRTDRALHAVMLDIDHFKRVNDTHGHGAGDDVIREVAARLRGAVADHHLVGRYGGEEFALVLPETCAVAASDLAERLRCAVAERPVDTRVGGIPVTISVGIAPLTAHDHGVGEVLGRADAALYQAKQAGRNRVVAGK